VSQTEARPAAHPPGPQPEPLPPTVAAPGSPGKQPLPSWHWRLVVFVWFSAMIFLGLYEFLYMLLKAIFH
jgi:hypothetical protein